MHRTPALGRSAVMVAGGSLLMAALIVSGLPVMAATQTASTTNDFTVLTPTAPTLPTSPTSPTAPTAPSDPTGPTAPTAPTSPTSPTPPTLPCDIASTTDCTGGGGTTTPSYVQVHILKYLQSGTTTESYANATTSYRAFPMEATWTASNLNGGTTTTGTFNLGFGETSTSLMATGASYQAHEVSGNVASSSDAVIATGGTCVAGHFRTVGYRMGNTRAEAEAAPLTLSAPQFTNLTGDRYLLVVNEYCLSDGMSGGGGGDNNGNGSTTASTTQTVVVHYGDLAQTSSDANANDKWFFWNGGTGTIDTSIGSDSFVNGPDTAPLGTGSVMLTATGTESHSIATNQFMGTTLADLSTLSFATYIPGVGIASTTFPVGTTTATTTSYGYQDPTVPFLAFTVDLDGSTTTASSTGGIDELIYMPEENGTVATDTWQTWNPLGNGKWTWNNFGTSTMGSTTVHTQWPDSNTSQFRHWTDIVSAFPHAVLSGMFGVGVKNTNTDLGTTTVASSTPTAFLDDLTIGIGATTTASTTIFDFEPTAPETASSGGGGGGGGGSSHRSSSSSSGGSSSGEVLGAACPLITSWMRENQYNDPGQVDVLQNFLNGEVGSSLSVSGFFDTATTAAVNDFQVKYWQDVLLPWVAYGLPTDHTPTGYVYKTTSTKINRIACPDMTFPDPVLP